MFGTRTRSYMPWLSLGRQLNRMNGEFSRMFSDGDNAIGSGFPAFNIYGNADGAVMSAELPGVDIKDIELTVSGNTVSIKGSRKEAEAETGHRIRRERRAGEFNRSFELPFNVESSKVEAKSSKGILTITLPRAETDKPKKIEVKIA